MRQTHKGRGIYNVIFVLMIIFYTISGLYAGISMALVVVDLIADPSGSYIGLAKYYPGGAMPAPLYGFCVGVVVIGLLLRSVAYVVLLFSHNVRHWKRTTIIGLLLWCVVILETLVNIRVFQMDELRQSIMAFVFFSFYILFGQLQKKYNKMDSR